MDDSRVVAAIVGGIAGIVGTILVSLFNLIFPSIGYVIRRKLERTSVKEDLEIIGKSVEIVKQFKAEAIPADVLLPQILEDSLGRNKLHRYIQFKEAENAEKILSKATEMIPDDFKKNDVNSDWFLKFLSYAKNIGETEVQEIWAKIFAGETEKSGSYSLRTLDALSRLTRQEAEIFEKAANLCIMEAFLFPYNQPVKFEEFGLKFSDLLLLDEADLLSVKELQWYSDYDTIIVAPYGKSVLLFKDKTPNPQPGKSRRATFSVLKFTQIGMELLKLVNRSGVNEQYVNRLRERYSAQFDIDILPQS